MRLPRNHNILAIVGSMVGFTIITGFCLTKVTIKASAVVQSANASVTVGSACTLAKTITTAHTANMTNGTYYGASGIGETLLQANCNDASGFAIYAIGYTGDTDGANYLRDNTLYSTYGNTYDIQTGTGTSGNSQWAMKLTTVSNDDTPVIQNSYDSYHTVPSEYALVANKASSTTISDGARMKATYTAYISGAQPAGTYEGKVKYVLVHPVNHSAPQYPQGLCTDADTCMQQQTSASLAQKLPNVGNTTTLYDSRDNQAYTVAKLADNKYWMVKNLNIAGGTALSADDTDVTSAYISSFSTSNNLTKTGDTIVLPASSTSGFNTNNYSYVYNSSNKTNCGASGQNTPCYSYYSWDAATLGSGRSISTDNTDAPYSICPKGWKLPTTRTTSASNWQTNSDFYQLAHQYGLDSTTSISESDNGFYTQAGPGTTLGFLLAGYYHYGSFDGGGSYGYYLSATSSSSTSDARYLYFNSSSVYSANSRDRYNGFSVRCLFSGQ